MGARIAKQRDVRVDGLHLRRNRQAHHSCSRIGIESGESRRAAATGRLPIRQRRRHGEVGYRVPLNEIDRLRFAGRCVRRDRRSRQFTECAVGVAVEVQLRQAMRTDRRRGDLRVVDPASRPCDLLRVILVRSGQQSMKQDGRVGKGQKQRRQAHSAGVAMGSQGLHGTILQFQDCA